MDRSYYTLYPNIYVILVGPSGMRKSIPINLAQKLVEHVDCTRVISGRSSIQAIIKDLGMAYTLKNKSIIVDSICYLVSPELDNMLLEDEHAANLLLDLYDTFNKDKWRNLLKAGIDNLKNIYLTILGASNETNLALALPKSATHGGLVARTSIILEERKKLINSLVKRPKIIPDIKELSIRLSEISKLSGEFKFDNGAGEYFDMWYKSFIKLESSEKTGTLDRLPDTALKVAMCISLSKKDDLILTRDDLDEAIDRCKETIVGMNKVFLNSGEHSLAHATAHVLRVLLGKKDHMISRKHLLGELCGMADAIDLDRIIDTLNQRCVIEVMKDLKNDVIYKMKEDVVKNFGRFLQGEQQ